MYDSILVATDGSDAATDAVDHAVELAGQFDVPLSGVAVLESRTDYDNAIVDPEETRRRQREQAERALSDLETRAEAVDVPVETTIRTGVPHEEILAAAEERDASAVVVGSRGRSSFTGALLGSTVDAIVRLANRPVLVVGDEAPR
ncbi:universal stress protein [Natrarchaeobius chitinivorans]|uniref:Universal stress protein n=1 Tax=Natrarchaeobius chitinivorans TaxID=1679083 RepID=A0A3N6LXL5_NATCH|nr:universal stress protein [Natrarchaeobius chitinivorans]RQG92534.1 universal stress protein [Natrarchaeobius chitinivorans]